ncbi:LexA family transcriptional regulator [Roseateles sp. PN1]|uniref:LexA family transcriptional regulator n=1 Tax=Roseateles sp. PN1 TaxID=3137372 RepID=UPI003139A265
MARPIETLAQRLAFARAQAGMTQGKLAELAGMRQPDISKIEKGLILQTTGIARLAAALNVSAAWLELGQEENGEPSPKAQMTPLTPGVEAHAMSQIRFETVPSLLWEQLMSEDPKGTFSIAVPDDAMAPRVRAGTECLFKTDLSARPGAGVLVRDSSGAVYLREYREAPGGAWEAHAANPAYRTLHSVADGLRVIAVLRAVMRGWEEI